MPQLIQKITTLLGLFLLTLLLPACASGPTRPPADAGNGWRDQLAQMAPPSHMAVGICAPAPTPIRPRAAEALEWAHPKPQGDNLLSIWGSDANNLWAVGDKGRILHSDGHTWRRQDRTTDDYLAGVWADPSGVAFVTGYNGRILHFDGLQWWNHPTGVSNDFNGIWGSGPDDVFTVADRGVIFHWDGNCWQRQESGTDNLFFGVWGSGPGNVWAVGGRGNVAHYDGTTWTQVDVGVLAHFVSVWGSSSSNVYMAGHNGTLLHRVRGNWVQEDLDTNELLRWIWGSGPNDVWVAGDGGVVRHFDGHVWEKVKSGITQAIRGGWQDADGTSYLVGDDGLLLEGTEQELTPVRRGTFSDLAVVSGNWAAGTDGTLMYRDADGIWHHKAIATAHTVAALAEMPRGRILAAAGSDLWQGNASGWQLLYNPYNAPIRAIRAWGKQAVAVTDMGQMLHFDGNAWSRLPGPMDDTGAHTPGTMREGTANGPGAPALFGLGGHGPDDFWLVGPSGRAFQYLKGQWHSRSLPGGMIKEDLTAVSASGVTVGMGGGIYRWQKNGWQRLTPEEGQLSLYAVADAVDSSTWAVGDFGTILEVEGSEIRRHHTITGQSLWGVAASPDGRITVVGDGATILERPSQLGVKVK